MGLWSMTANKIAEVFGCRVIRKLKVRLNAVLEQIEHGHHIFRAYYRSAFIKQYEKFSTFLRNEACSNNLADFGMKKGLDDLAAVREKMLAVTPLRRLPSSVAERARRLYVPPTAGAAHHG